MLFDLLFFNYTYLFAYVCVSSALKLLCVKKVAQRGASGGVLAGCGLGLGVGLVCALFACLLALCSLR